ncbi:MAG: hypothetical protein JSV88_00865 [Candidatus Aminicenantes bacterium]|nr:MAG: hypothetical protein JSV88_00865 [Candidatus Aminicenantes bacterium]
MNVKKKVFVLSLLFGMFCLFTTGALAIDVLYAPLEGFYNQVQGKTNVYVYDGVSLQPLPCKIQNGLVPVGGIVGKALSFNGKRHITVLDSDWLDLGTDDFAITFWVQTRSTKTYNTIIEKRESHPRPGYHVVLYKGRPLLHLCQSPGGSTNWLNYWGGMNSTAVNDGKWHYVAIYVERNNRVGGKIYVDGLCVHTFNPTSRSGSLSNKADLLIGGHCDWNHAYFEGTLDELWIFRGQLSGSSSQ